MGIYRELYFFYGMEIVEQNIKEYVKQKQLQLAEDNDMYIDLSEMLKGFLVLQTMSGNKYFLVAAKPEPCEEDKVYKLDPLTSGQSDDIKSLMYEFNVQGEIKPICIITNY